MSKRTALLATFFFSFLLLGFVQLSSLSSAHAEGAPLTPPVTSPTESMFTISGKITVKNLNLHALLWRFMPAAGVRVKLENILTHQKMSTMTDAEGMYSFGVDEKGLYKVMPDTDKHLDGIAVPPLRFITLKKHDALHEDFQLLNLHN
jgi:hypothetical protein